MVALPPPDHPSLMRYGGNRSAPAAVLCAIAHSRPGGSMAEEKVTLPIVEEAVEMGKSSRTTIVRVTSKVEHDQQRLEDTLAVEDVSVERVPAGQWVDGPQPIRQEGDTTVFPVVEEVAVVQKRFRLVEEVRVTKHAHTEPFVHEADVRRTRIAVERIPQTPSA